MTARKGGKPGSRRVARRVPENDRFPATGARLKLLIELETQIGDVAGVATPWPKLRRALATLPLWALRALVYRVHGLERDCFDSWAMPGAGER